MDKIRALIKKHWEFITYVFFGGLTTVVNYVSYLLLAPYFAGTTIPTAAAWVLSVIFAYLTNRKWVFHSAAQSGKALAREAASFLGARLLSGVMDIGVMWFFVDKLGFSGKIVKLASNIFVVLFNYVVSKLVIFKARGEK